MVRHNTLKKNKTCRGKPIEDIKHYVITGKQTTYFQTTEQRAIYDRSKGHTFSHCQVNLQEGMTTIIIKVLLERVRDNDRRYLQSVGAWKKSSIFGDTEIYTMTQLDEVAVWGQRQKPLWLSVKDYHGIWPPFELWFERQLKRCGLFLIDSFWNTSQGKYPHSTPFSGQTLTSENIMTDNNRETKR